MSLTTFDGSRLVLLFMSVLYASSAAWAVQDAPDTKKSAPEKVPGQFFVVEHPITEASVRRLETAAQAFVRKELEAGKAPILIFEFQGKGASEVGSSRFGAVLELCQVLSRKLTGARLVVGYVPEPLTGFAALGPLACQEVIFGPTASVGSIVPPGTDALTVRTARSFVADLAASLGRSPDLYEALVDDRTELTEVTTGDNTRHYVLKERLDDFAKTRAIALQQSAWPPGSKRELSAEKARGVLSRLTVDKKTDILDVYRLDPIALRSDPTLGTAGKALLIQVTGNLDRFKAGYIRRKLGMIENSDVNVLILEVDARGADSILATEIADRLENLKNIRKIAYVVGKAEGSVVLPLLACDIIYVAPGATIGDTYLQKLPDGRNKPELPSREMIATVRARAMDHAGRHAFAPGLASGLFDPERAIVEAQDLNSGGVVAIDKSEAEADPKRFRVRREVKPAGESWLLDSTSAVGLGLADLEESRPSLIARLGLDQDNIETVGPSWVDYLVAILNNRLISFMVLTLGLFLLVLEFKLPGIGLPAIGSAICFTLFFWSHYLSGTADQLEILLFAIGLICLAIELFVLPGFGVFGLAGVMLTIVSIVLASHTFLWPSGSEEYRQMGLTLTQLLAAMAVVVVAIVWVGRNMHRIPMLNGLVLSPDEPADATGPDPLIVGDSDLNLSFLMGRIGKTSTPMRPTGKARFEDHIVDATALTGYIDEKQSVEVVAVRGLRVIVRPVRSPDERIHDSREPFRFDEGLFES
jgi:membrane-bound serine protease (ClpP class)